VSRLSLAIAASIERCRAGTARHLSRVRDRSGFGSLVTSTLLRRRYKVLRPASSDDADR
jgi:hypothetical protein